MEPLKPSQVEHALRILENIEQNPETTQASLATQLGVAVGSVNWYLKRLIARGYIKVSRLQRKRLRYLITPRGIAEKSRLAYRYMQISLQVYRQVRTEAKSLLDQAQAAGYREICIRGDGDLAEICGLTCLEQGLTVVAHTDSSVPVLEVDGARLLLRWPESRA
jgi:DNA-binding MarR family transcriptional regulator